MLADIAAEALHILTRRNLDKACVVNKQFNGLIDLYSEVYPLRSVFKVELLPSVSDFKLTVLIEEKRDSGTYHTFGGMDEAVHYTASILRHSDVEHLELRDPGYSRGVTLSPGHLTMLVDATRSGGVQFLVLSCVDFSVLGDDVLHLVIGCHGLRSLDVLFSVVPSGYVTDAVIRSCAAKGVLELHVFCKNKSDALYRLSDEAVLDFFFRPAEAPEGQSLSLKVKATGLTDLFISKFFERLLSSPLRSSGSLEFYDAGEQRGLAAYTQYLTPRAPHSMRDTYRFPSIGDDTECCDVRFAGGWANSREMHLWFDVRLRSTPVRPRGSLTLYGAAKQRGLAAYTQHLAPGEMHGRGVKYHLPSIDDDNRSFEVSLYESTANFGDVGTCAHTDIDFGPIC